MQEFSNTPPSLEKERAGVTVLTLLTLFARESRPARALPGDVVAVGPVLALAHIGTVLPIKSSWATFQQSEQGKSKE